MDEQKKTSGSLALNSTPQVITIPPSDPVRVRKLRVAAYARVSSSSEDQLNSFAAQNAHYTELITANPEWEFVDVYADKGDHRHLGGEAGRLPAAAGRLPPGPGGQDPCEVLLPVCPERQRVPGGCPGTEGPGGGGVLRGAGHRHL